MARPPEMVASEGGAVSLMTRNPPPILLRGVVCIIVLFETSDTALNMQTAQPRVTATYKTMCALVIASPGGCALHPPSTHGELSLGEALQVTVFWQVWLLQLHVQLGRVTASYCRGGA